MTSASRTGNCTDCGKAVWRQDDRLVSENGLRWCFGANESHVGMTHHHALPGMAQWIAPSPIGQVCRCLDRKDPHVHLITDIPPEDGLTDQAALDQIAQILRLHAGAGHAAAIARVIQRTGRATRAQDLD